MNETQKYFIHLLSSHLNNSPPLPNDSADWMGVFKLGELHNVTAMLTLSIRKLPIESRPDKKLMNLFNQALGQTVQRYEIKIDGIDKLNSVLNENKIRRLFLKGAAIREYYPYAEVRTSGDTDLVIDKENHIKTAEALINSGFRLEQQTDNQNVLFYNEEEFEIKNSIDCFNKKCEEYFENSFDDKKCIKDSDYIYYLKPTYHLIYIISHFLRHLTDSGAGIRQLMDVDVLIRSGEVDFNEFYSITEELNFKKSSQAVLSLSKQYFATPIEDDYVIEPELREKLEKVILEGGVFGFAISDTGTRKLVKSINITKSRGFKASFKAFMSILFPKKIALYNSYSYAKKHHILLLIAYFNKLFEAVFKRGKYNIKKVNNIFNNKETALMLNDIINELEIEKDF